MFDEISLLSLTFTTLLAVAANDKMMIYLFFPQNRLWHFVKIVFFFFFFFQKLGFGISYKLTPNCLFFFFFFFSGHRLWHFMQIGSLYEMSKPIFWGKKKSKCCLLKTLPCMLRVKAFSLFWKVRVQLFTVKNNKRFKYWSPQYSGLQDWTIVQFVMEDIFLRLHVIVLLHLIWTYTVCLNT